MSHDAIIHRLQNLDPFVVQQIDPQGMPRPWVQVTGPAIVGELVISPHTLRDQIDAIAAQVAHWGRLVAQTKRVWQVHERRYRHWRSTVELKLLTESEKKPTQAVIEATYRTLPEYELFQKALEEAEEAHNATTAIYEAFRVKAQVLRSDLHRAPDGSIQRWSP